MSRSFLPSPRRPSSTPSPFPLFPFSPLLLLSFSLFFLTFLYISSRAHAHPTITPEQAIALALGDIEPVGENFRISDMGGDVLYDATLPAVAFNSINNQYLIVWSGDDNTDDLVDGHDEIFGQLIDGATGAEIGSDFRISSMGPDGDTDVHADVPAVTYNLTGNEYLIVWHGYKNTGGLISGENEIFGQRLDAPTALKIGGAFRISDMGPDGSADWDATYPAIAYNFIEDQYLVVWQGDDNSGGLVDNEYEIYGQRLEASTGAEIGQNDFRISDMGSDGDINYNGAAPNIVFNSIENEYYVVWHGDDNTGGLVDGESEIFGQRIDGPSGDEIGGDVRISDIGIDGDPNSDAIWPSSTYNPLQNEYLIVWEGDDTTGGMVDNEKELFGQGINGATGAEIGANDFRISDMGPDGDPSYQLHWSSVVYNSVSQEYLVIWHGNDNIEGVLGNEIYAQRLSGLTRDEVGSNDFRISEMGYSGSFVGIYPSVALNTSNNEYLIVWQGDDNLHGLVYDEYEIFAQRLDSAGAEIGADDFRISDMGGDDIFDGWHPKVAYNATDNLYLVVWHGDDNTGAMVDNENEIFGQLIDASTGEAIGPNDFRISDMGSDGDLEYDALDPTLAYNPNTNEFLVVWEGDDNIAPLVEDELEIFGQRLDAATGAEIGSNDFRISQMGPDGNAGYDAYGSPSVVYNPTEDEYLVVWFGDAGTGGMVDNEREVFGQRLEGDSGAEIGADFRISDMGGDGDINYVGDYPTIAYNSASNEYLVVWHGDDNVNGFGDEEYEIFGQRLNAATGVEVGPNDFRISDMGDSSPIWGGFLPAVAYNPTNQEYLVVWNGDDNASSMADQEYEIYGQRLTATGAELGVNDFRISDMGPDGDANFEATNVSVVYLPSENEYLVVWHGEDNVGGLIVNESEIFGQRLDAPTGNEIGSNDFRMSWMAETGIPNYDAYYPALAYNSFNLEMLVVWSGDDNTNGLVDEEMETFGQRLMIVIPTPTPTPTPTNTPTATHTPIPPPAGTPGPLYLPIAIRPLPCLIPYLESEPNGPPQTDADGPLCLNQPYTAYPDDSWDYFTFTLNNSTNLVAQVTNHPLAGVNGLQVQLYFQAVSPSNKVGEAISQPYQIEYAGLAGTYYLLIYTDTSKCGPCELPYTVQVNSP